MILVNAFEYVKNIKDIQNNLKKSASFTILWGANTAPQSILIYNSNYYCNNSNYVANVLFSV